MSLITRNSESGIDKPISRIQAHLFNSLGWEAGSNIYKCYPRVYKNQTAQGIIPEFWNEAKQDYEDVRFDDTVAATSFFLDADIRTGDKKYNTDISIIFQLKLNEIYPGTDRNDELAHVDVLNALEIAPTGAKIKDLKTGISNVYQGMRTADVIYTDMQDFHVFRVDMYIYFNNCNC